MKKHTILKLAISMGLALAVGLTSVMVPFGRKCESIRQSVFRLHIIANSDSERDQALKLAVRDKILELSDSLFAAAENEEQAIAAANENLELIKEKAAEVLYQNGCNASVAVSVGSAYFNTREYDDFTLPAGNYQALKIVIGEGKGKNWWCVMFPAVCIPAAKGDIEDALQEGEAEIVKSGTKYKPAFKILEIYEQIKRFFKK